MEVLKTQYQIEIINRIRFLRIEKNISQIKLANILNVSTGYIGNVESTKFRHKYTLKQLCELSKFFNITLDFLFTGKNVSLTKEQLINNIIDYDE